MSDNNHTVWVVLGSDLGNTTVRGVYLNHDDAKEAASGVRGATITATVMHGLDGLIQDWRDAEDPDERAERHHVDEINGLWQAADELEEVLDA